MSDHLKKEHQLIAEFVRTRVFPSLDEFTSAHGLTVSIESGLLVLLAKRLVYQGFSETEVNDVVRDATAPPKTVKQAAGAEPSSTTGGNVIMLRRPAPP